MITMLTDSNVDDVIKSDKATYILFYNDNIPALQDIKKIFEGFDKQLNGKVNIMFCDLYSQGYVAEYFKMSIMPAVLFLKSGKVYGNLAGQIPASKYTEILKEALAKLVEEQKKDTTTVRT